MQTFSTSDQALAYLQGKYGSANYSQQQSLRKTFWSNVAYPQAGQASFVFFGDAVGNNGLTLQFTNMPKAGTFGTNHFLVKGISTGFWLADYTENRAFDADDDVLYSDLINGLFQAGVLSFKIGDREFATINKPFLYAPPADGRFTIYPAGIQTLTLAEGAPNTFESLTTVHPSGQLATRKTNKYMVDPNILIEAEQSFSVSIDYPSGALAAIAQAGPISSNTVFRIQVLLDGIVFRPVQ